MGLFGSRKAVIGAVSEAALMADDRPSLFLAGGLSLTGAGEGLRGVLPYGYLNAVGFASGWAEPLSAMPPPDPLFVDNGCLTRLFEAKPDRSVGDLGILAVDEERIEDTRMRAALDFTGLAFRLMLRPDAQALFMTLFGPPRPWSEYHPGFVIRIATDPFPFPEPRGNPDPWGHGHVTDLRPVKRLAVRTMAIALVDASGSASLPRDTPMRDRFASLSAWRMDLGRG